MNEERQFKVQAYLDGELPSNEAREVVVWLAQDAEATGLAAELKNTRQALAGFEAEIKLPEAREFYWSKIERAIESAEKAPAAKATLSLSEILRKLLVPAMGVAAVVLMVSLIGPQAGIRAGGDAEMETALAEANAFTYRDYKHGTTLVWLPYPAENEFTDTQPADILD